MRNRFAVSRPAGALSLMMTSLRSVMRLVRQPQEHLVERRPPQVDVLGFDSGVAKKAQGVGECGHAVRDRDAHPPCVGIEPGAARLGRRDPTERVRGARQVVGAAHDDVDAVAAERGLQLVGRAVCDGAAGRDEADRGRQLVGLVEVLGGEQHRGATATRARTASQTSMRPRGSRPGRGFVEEQHRRRDDELLSVLSSISQHR
jgi:hypothetical protein